MKLNKNKAGASIAALALIGALPEAAKAAVVVSGEVVTMDADLDGGIDDASISYVTFDVTGGTSLTLDILALEQDQVSGLDVDLNGDSEITTLDAMIHLIDNSTHNILYSNDDHGNSADGSIHNFDSYIATAALSAGSYTLAISSYNFEALEALDGLNLNSTSSGDWRLTITETGGSISNVVQTSSVPEPSSAALLGLGSFALLLRRKRA